MIGDGPRHYGPEENLTLSDADLAAHGGPRPYKGGEKLRAYCPVHGGDNQRSLELTLSTGRFFCHNCGCWGYMDWAREEFRRERGLEKDAARQAGRSPARRVLRAAPPPPPVEPAREDLDALAGSFAAALPGSLGEKYLEHRGIPVELAREHGVGYALRGKWPHKGRDWRYGRLTAPHSRPDGLVVNMYGRAVGSEEKVPKQMRHDHLPGSKGYWNARALVEGVGPLYVVEGLVDALALMACGCERVVAIFAARDWRWHWVGDEVRRSGMVLAFDADETGVDAREKLLEGAALRGIRVAYLDAEAYGGEDDPAAAFAAGKLTVGEWPERPRADADGETRRRRDDADRRKRRRAEAEAALARAREEAELDRAVGPAAPKSPAEPRRAPATDADGLTVERVVAELRREGSGPALALSNHRKSPGEKTFAYVVRAVLHALGLDPGGWRGHAGMVRAAVEALDWASDPKVVALDGMYEEGAKRDREELSRVVAAPPADVPDDPREHLRRNVARRERGGA